MSEKEIGSNFGKYLEEFPSDVSSGLQMLVDDLQKISPYAEQILMNADFDERQRTASPIKEASPEFKEFDYEIPRKNYKNWIKDEVEPIVDMSTKNKNEMQEVSFKSVDCFQPDRSMNAYFSPQSFVNCELIDNRELIAVNKDSPCIVFVQNTNKGDSKLPDAVKETKQELTQSFIPNTYEADFKENRLNDFIQKDKDNRLCGLLGYTQNETIFDKSEDISEPKTGKISKYSQYNLENQVLFEEKKYLTEEIEGDIKKPNLQNLTVPSLSDYSTPEKSNFGDSTRTLEGIIDEISNRTHQCDIKNTGSKNLIQETPARLTEKSYFTSGETNFGCFLSFSKDITSEIIDKTRQCDIKSIDSESLLFTSDRNNSSDSLSNSEAKISEINETDEFDLENETNLSEENADFKQIERMDTREIVAKWCDEVNHCITIDAFSNTSETKTDGIINEKNEIFESEAKSNVVVDGGNSNFKQNYPQNLPQANESTEISLFSGVKSYSNEFECALEATNNITNVIKQECEQRIAEGDTQLPGQNTLSEFSPKNEVSGLSEDAKYKQKLRPRKQNDKLDNVNFVSKLKRDTLKSEDIVLDEIQEVQENSITKVKNTRFETVDVEDSKSNSDIIYCFRCKQSIMDITRDDKVYNTILEQNKNELNKDYDIQTLFDLFSIDQTVSTNILKCLSSEEFRPGALVTEIIRFLRQESSLTASTKIKDDVKKFLGAAKDAGWIELKNRRYKLAGYVINLPDGEKEAVGTSSKRKISQPKNQIKRKKLL